MTAPANKEQEICKACGFCCDGTLFTRATSFKGEQILPKMIHDTDKNGDTWIKLPCQYFDECCTVYDKKRPNICGDFKCHLLKKSIKGKMAFDDLAQLIEQIKTQKERISKLLPNHPEGERLQSSFDEFMEQHKSKLDQKEFRLQHSQLLMEWASYQNRLTKFSKPNADTKKEQQ